MNYAVHYVRLIERARHRTLDGYREHHHVIPRCMGGDDSSENIVELTPEEHYVAHQLLVRIYPNNRRLVHAAVLMAKRCAGNKAFGWLQRRKVTVIRLAMLGNHNTLGKKLKPRSAEHCANISAAKLGKTVMSAEACAKMSEAHKGKRFSKQHRRNLSRSLKGKPHDFSWNGRRVGSGNPNWKGGIRGKSSVL